MNASWWDLIPTSFMRSWVINSQRLAITAADAWSKQLSDLWGLPTMILRPSIALIVPDSPLALTALSNLSRPGMALT